MSTLNYFILWFHHYVLGEALNEHHIFSWISSYWGLHCSCCHLARNKWSGNFINLSLNICMACSPVPLTTARLYLPLFFFTPEAWSSSSSSSAESSWASFYVFPLIKIQVSFHICRGILKLLFDALGALVLQTCHFVVLLCFTFMAQYCVYNTFLGCKMRTLRQLP